MIGARRSLRWRSLNRASMWQGRMHWQSSWDGIIVVTIMVGEHNKNQGMAMDFIAMGIIVGEGIAIDFSVTRGSNSELINLDLGVQGHDDE